MVLFIKMPDRNILSFQVDLSDTIKNVKNKGTYYTYMYMHMQHVYICL